MDMTHQRKPSGGKSKSKDAPAADKKDVKESKELRELKESKESKEVKDTKDASARRSVSFNSFAIFNF
jgi:hypothetical protein